MRVLLDECFPRGLRKELFGHDAKTVREAGWAGVKNGALLERAAKEFDVLLTVDRNLEYQQNFAGVALAVIVVDTPSNDIDVLRPFMPRSTRGDREGKAGDHNSCRRLTARSSGAPVSTTAGYPRAAAPRRPLNDALDVIVQAHRNLRIIAATSGLLLLLLYLHLSLVDYTHASDFCAKVRPGISSKDLNSLAEGNYRKPRVAYRPDGEIRVLFSRWHSCQCDLWIRDDRVIFTKAWCTD